MNLSTRNMQKDKNLARDTKSLNTLKKLAKIYDVKIPKVINNVDYFRNRVRNTIDNIQHSNYNENLGINAGKNKFDKIYDNRTGNKSSKTRSTNMNYINSFVRQLKEIRKTLCDISTYDLGDIGYYLRLGYDNKEKLLRTAQVSLLKDSKKLTNDIKEALNPEYFIDMLNGMNKNYQFFSPDEINSLTSEFSKLSKAKRIQLINKGIEEFKLRYREEITELDDIEDKKDKMSRIFRNMLR